MYCPSCGNEYAFGLPYCNRCGANLNSSSELAESGSVDVTKAVAAIGTTMGVLTLGGFMALIIGAVKLAEKAAMGSDPIIIMIAMGMVTILVVDILLARQLSRLLEASLTSRKPRKPSLAPPQMNPELGRPITSPLPPSLSVTENTTRFLEHEYREPSQTEAPAALKDLKS